MCKGAAGLFSVVVYQAALEDDLSLVVRQFSQCQSYRLQAFSRSDVCFDVGRLVLNGFPDVRDEEVVPS